MDHKRPLSLALFLVLSFAAYSYILRQEVLAYELMFGKIDGGFKEFMQRSANGKPLYLYVNMDTVGVFKINGMSIACAGLHTELPEKPSKAFSPQRP